MIKDISAGWKTSLENGKDCRYYFDPRQQIYPSIAGSPTFTGVDAWRYGSHDLTGGYAEYLYDMPATFTFEIKAYPNFAYDTSDDPGMFAWYYDSDNYFLLRYMNAVDKFYLSAKIAGNASILTSQQFDDGASYDDLNQWLTFTGTIDTTTGDTSGSAFYVNRVLQDDTWAANITAISTALNKIQFRAINGTAGDYKINYFRLFPNYVATAAEVANGFKDVYDEEIFWGFNGVAIGKTRCNITKFVTSYGYQERFQKNNGSFCSNTANLTLTNEGIAGATGCFCDDQYAAFDAGSYQYNGTVAQKYLQNRMPVYIESWYGTDFDSLFIGKVTEKAFPRSKTAATLSRISVSCEDGISDIARKSKKKAKYYDSYTLCNNMPSEDDLIAYWSCDEGTGTILKDTVGGYDGTLVGGTTWTDGISGKAVSFDGVDDYVNLGASGFPTFTGSEFSLSMWFKASDLVQGDFARIFSFGDGSTTQMYADCRHTGSQFFLVRYDDYTNLTSQALTASIDTDTHHLAYSISGTTWDIYFDGVLLATKTLPIAYAGFTPTMFRLANNTAGFKGWIDEVRIYNRALTAAEVSGLYSDIAIPYGSSGPEHSLMHVIARLATKEEVYNYLANSSFENATITDSWAEGANCTLTRDATHELIGSYCGKAVFAGAGSFYQTVTFTGVNKINVGESYTFSIYINSLAAAFEGDLKITEADSVGDNANTTATVSLAGGTGYQKFTVTHTITDADSDRLRFEILSDAADTIYFDVAMGVKSGRDYNWFVLNNNNGAAGVESADDADYDSYDTIAFVVDSYTIEHPWARIEAGESLWEHLKDIADATPNLHYFGMDACGNLEYTHTASAAGDPASVETIDTTMAVATQLEPIQANKIIISGIYIVEEDTDREIWNAKGDSGLTLPVWVNDGTQWPNADYGDFWAEVGKID